MSAIDRFATLVSDVPRDYPATAVWGVHLTQIATIACIFAAVATWIGKPCQYR